MSYIPAFVFGDPKYYLAFLPSGILRRDVFDIIRRKGVSDKINIQQEKNSNIPIYNEVEEYQNISESEIAKAVQKANDLYSK